jgi:hypothetical protein
MISHKLGEATNLTDECKYIALFYRLEHGAQNAIPFITRLNECRFSYQTSLS